MSTDAVGVELWNAAAEAVLKDAPGAAEAARAVLAHDPRLGVARALAAAVPHDRSLGHGHDHETARSAELRRAFDDGHTASGRESSLIHVLHLHALGHIAEMGDHLVVHTALYPADPLVSRMLYGGLLSRTEPAHRTWTAGLIERQAAAAPADSWPWMSVLAFLRAEQHRCDEAADLAQRVLAIEPDSAFAAHVLMHVHHDTGAGRTGVAWIDDWLRRHPRTPRRRHYHWHAALHALAAGDIPEARRRTADELAATDIAARSSVNWRLRLAGQNAARPVTADEAGALLADEDRAMSTAANAFHIALTLAVAGDADSLDRLARQARRRPEPSYSTVLAPVANALALLLRGSPHRAADLLTDLRHQAWLLGLTAPEQEIIEDTLARALTAADRPDEAADLLHHRMDTRSTTIYERMLCTALS
ncbi:hypothetical protein [Streptomyces sp. NPDC057695]|uniref:hypothetical protein n=1 Tax=Streptomyces sp. NPDC057695 TaxID=3346217 RepID=UPI0036830D2C